VAAPPGPTRQKKVARRAPGTPTGELPGELPGEDPVRCARTYPARTRRARTDLPGEDPASYPAHKYQEGTFKNGISI
jgi:hypothetical protein